MADSFVVIDNDSTTAQQRTSDLDPSHYQAKWEQMPTPNSKGILRVESSRRAELEQDLRSKNLNPRSFESMNEAKSI